MDFSTRILKNLTKSIWVRFWASLFLALFLVALFIFFPVVIKSSAPEENVKDKLIDMSLPFEAGLVYATGGLTVTKSASLPSAGPGELITYTLIMTNQTGFNLVNFIITDVLPIDTTCETVIPPSGPGRWISNDLSCNSDGYGLWVHVYDEDLPAPFNTPIPDGQTLEFTFTVRIDEKPFINQSTITNSNYAVIKSEKQTMTGTLAFTATGPVYTTLVNAPTWSITKAAASTVQPGQYLTYTITAENVGDFTTSGTYTITDALPQYTTYFTSTPVATVSGSSLTWVFNNALNINQTRVVTYVVQITNPLTNGLAIVNDSYAVTGGNVYSGAIGQAISTTVIATADLTVTKTTDPAAMVEAGALLTYTLTITNQSSAQGPADNVVISDTLPSNTVYQSAGFLGGKTGTITRTGNLVEWRLDNPIGVNSNAQVQVVVRVQSPLPNGSTIVNTPGVSATNITADVVGNPVTTIISSSSKIDGLSKSVDPTTVIPGGTVTYTITITNSGNETATGVLVSDTLDAAFPAQNHNFSNVTVPGRNISGTPGITTVVFNTAAPGSSGVYSNTVITVTNGAEVDTLLNTAPIVVATPVISLTKLAASSVVSAGDNLVYTLYYTNSGIIPATNVFITDTLPGNVNLVSTTPATSSQTGNVIGFDLGTVGAAAKGTVTITVNVPATVNDNTIINNSAVITSSQGAGDSAGPVPVTVRAPVLNIVKTDVTDPVQAGGLLTYTLTYSNSGGAIATNTRITDTFDSNAPFASASVSPLPPCTAGSTQCSWNVGNLAPNSVNQSIVVTVSVASPLPNNTTLTNTAIIATVGHSDQSTETTTVSSSEILNIVKTGSNGASMVKPGDYITYTIAYSNSGNAIAQNVRITDTIDSNTTFQSASAGVNQVNATTYVLTRSTLVPSSTLRFTVSVRITDSLPNNTVITNNVVIRSQGGVQATDLATATVQSLPELYLVKTSNANTVDVGGTLTYTIFYSNTGDAPATGVWITDTLPAELHLDNATPAPTGGSDPTYTWNIGNVPVGGPFSITLVVTADNVITDFTMLTNQVMMTSVETGTLTASKIVIARGVDLEVNKTVSSSPVKANEFITYTLTVANNGNATASNVTITDTLPISIVSSSVVSSASGGVTFSSFTGPNIYRWNASSLAGNSSLTVTISGRLNTGPWSAGGDVFTNTAEASWPLGEVDVSNNSDGEPATGRPGDPFTITLTAVPTTTNVGNTVAVTATVTDRWGNPAYNGESITFQSAFGTIGSPRITSNGVAATTISATGPGVAAITATATTSGITSTTTVTFTANADLQISKSRVGSGPVTAGDLIVYSVRITNAPGSATVNAVVTDTFPTAAVDSVMGCGGCTVGSGILTWNVNNFAANNTQSFTVIFDTSPTYSGTLTNTVGITFSAAFSGFTDTNKNNNTDRVTDTIRLAEADLSVNKALVSSNNINIGDPITYTLTVTNNGPDSANVTITDTFTNATLANTIGASCLGSGPVVCTLSNFAVGTRVITVVLNTSSSISGTVSNTAEVTPTNAVDNNAGLNISTAPPVTVQGMVQLGISKSASPGSGSTVQFGNTINYQMVISNSGSYTATNIIISDTLDANVGYVTGSISGGSGPFINGKVLSYTVSSLGPGASVTASVQVTVTASASGTTISNRASVDSNETGATLSNLVTHKVITASATGDVYLPIVINGSASSICADLQISNMTVSAGNVVNITVVNNGTCATDSNFWVDLYANPATLPNALVGVTADRRWNSASVNATHGVFWEVPALGSGASRTLTSDGSLGSPPPQILDPSHWPPSGSVSLYAFVDSYDSNDPNNALYVEIQELNENNNQFGPVINAFAAGLNSEDEPSQSSGLPRRDLR